MAKDFSGNYFRHVTEGAFDFKEFEEIVRKEVRAVHVKWGEQMAAGYNKIVADWSTETRPHFQFIPRYIRATGNMFVYIYIRGTPLQKMIFDNLDHGAKRGQWVEAGAGLPRTPEEEKAVSSYRQPPEPITYPTQPRGGKPVAWRKDPAWVKYEKETKLSDKRVKKGKAKTAKRLAGPGRTKKQSRLGPTPYAPRTSKSGAYRGPGYSASANPAKSRNRGATSDSKWRGRGQPKRMKLKPIAARRWTLRLTWLIKGRSWPHAEEIWGPKQKMMHKHIVELCFRNIRRAIKAK